MKNQTSRLQLGSNSKAFTLIELLLAVGLGAIVIVIAGGIFLQIDRTEAMLKARSEQTNDLERLRFVVQRVTSTMVMSNEAQAARETTGEEVDGASRAARNRNARDPSTPLPAPRLLVEPDPRLSGLSMYSTGGNQFKRDGVRPQRFEVVVSDSPVPQREPLDVFIRAGLQPGERLNRAAMAGALRGDVSGSSRQRGASGSSSSAGGKGDLGAGGAGGAGGGSGGSAGSGKMGESKGGEKNAGASATGDTGGRGGGTGSSGDPAASGVGSSTGTDASEVTPVRAFRGAFELRPMPVSQGDVDDARVQGVDVEQAWEMWWVPLPPRRDMDSTPSDYERAAAGEPYLVASNLRFVKWMMFDDGEEKSAISSTWTAQLPAYIELSVETTAGLASKWMFEVDWGQGPEVPPEPQDLGPKRATAVDESGQPAGQAGGQPGTSPGGRPALRPKTNEKGGK